MRSVLLSDLVTRCKQRADLENDDHISATEWKSLLSEMVGELHELADEAGLRYFESEATITATGAAAYALPTDHLATIRIARVDTSGRHCPPLVEIQIAEADGPLRGMTGEARYFTLTGQNVTLYPNPASGSYVHTYVPQPADLSAASDSTPVDLICAAGEAFVVWGTKVKACDKSETDVAVAMAERDAARARLVTWLQARSFITPRRMVVGHDGDRDRPYDPADWRGR